MSLKKTSQFSLEVLKKITAKNPIIGRALVNQIIGWPTSPPNLTKNCKIFQQLNKVDDIIVEDLSDECYELLINSVIIRKSLIQRGLMNMQYYIQLNKAMRDNETKGGKKQKGGMKIKELIANLCALFLLLGVSEGIDNSMVSKDEVSGNQVFSAPLKSASSKKEFEKSRVKQAQSQLDAMLDSQPWQLPDNSIVLAKDVTSEQIQFLTEKIGDLNSLLAVASKDAKIMCGEISTEASRLDVFSNDAFYESVLQLADKITVDETAPTVSQAVASTMAYGWHGAFNVVSAASEVVAGYTPVERQVDENGVMQKAYDTVVERQKLGIARTVETFGRTAVYKGLCIATPTPQFEIIETTVGVGGESRRDLSMRTHFGNYMTGQLLLAHMDTIQRIDLILADPNLSEKDKNALQSVKERTQIEIDLIGSSTLFIPLDGIIPGPSAVGTIISDSTIATEQFVQIVSRIGEILPITEADARAAAKIRKAMNQLKKETREQIINEWTVYISQKVKAAKEVIVETTTTAAEGLSDVAQTVAKETGDVLNVAAEGVGKVANTLTNSAADIINTMWMPLVGFLGIAGAAAYILIWTKRNLLTFGNGTGNGNNQQLQQQNQLILQLLQQVQQGQPLALPAPAPILPEPAPAAQIIEHIVPQRRASLGGSRRTLKRKYSKKISKKVKKNKTKKNKKTKKSRTKK